MNQLPLWKVAAGAVHMLVRLLNRGFMGLLPASVCLMCGALQSQSLLAQGSIQNTTDPVWVFQSKPNAKVAVVFIHGIFGDTRGTWTNSDGKTFFQFLRDAPKVGSQADIFAFGFTSNMLKPGSLDIREAANKLYAHLQLNGVWDYPRVAFVAHSMGGLVVLRTLISRREHLGQVPLIVLLATPQEGAQIAAIARLVLRNPGLWNMSPSDSNTFLQSLNDDWRLLPSRPRVVCGYEKLPTYGVMIVPWTSATRYCDGAPSPIENSDHLTIAKPDRALHDSVVLVVNALNEHVLGKKLVTKLDTPDFVREGDRAVFTIRDANGKSSARLVNSGLGKLRYTLAELSDPALFLWPDDTPREILGQHTEMLHMALSRAATSDRYSFVLRTEGLTEQRIEVRVPGMKAPGPRDRLKAAVTRDLGRFVGDADNIQRLAKLPPRDPTAAEELVRVAQVAVATELPDIPASGQWMVTADLLAASNWPQLATIALKRAESVSSSISKTASAQMLAEVVSLQSGEARVFPVIGGGVGQGVKPYPLLDSEGSLRLAESLKALPTYRIYGLSLEGDIAYARGDKDAARNAYAAAGEIWRSPSLDTRIAALGRTPILAGGEVLVRIGHVGPTSGGIAHLGKDNENGARLAIDELNAKGVVIGGRIARFELVPEDDAGDPKQGTAVAQKLVDSKVNGVIGHLNSGTSIPASKVYADAGIPQISPSSTNPKFTRSGYKTTFRVVADDAHLGGTLGRYAVKELKAKLIAVVDDRTAYGQGVADEFEKAVKAAGGTIVERQFTTDKATDFTAILTAVKSKKPDVLFYGGMDAVAGPMIRQMKQLGINAKLLGGDGICSGELPRLAAGTMTDGQVICAEAGGVDSKQRALAEDFKMKFKAKFNTDVQIYAPYVYDSVNVMVAAMVKAGSADPAKYLPVLAKTENYHGVTGEISFDSRGDLKNAALTLYTYKGDKREELKVVR